MTGGGFQTQVATQPAPAVAGDFCSTNPRKSLLAGPGGIVSGPAGCFVGRACWVTNPADGDFAPATAQSFGTGNITGIIHREQNADIVTYLADSSMLIKAGTQMTVMTDADFWVKNDGTTTASPGQKAYANFADGKFTFAATATPSGATASSWSLAPETSTITATVTNDIMTVTAVTGTYGVALGAAPTGGTGPSGNTVVSQVLPLLAGEALNGVGRYVMSLAEVGAGLTYTGLAFSLLTLTTVSAGNFGVGDVLSSTTPLSPLAPYISQILTGTGGSGTTAIASTSQTASSGTLTGATNVETKYFCRTTGAAGELVKISPTTLQ